MPGPDGSGIDRPSIVRRSCLPEHLVGFPFNLPSISAHVLAILGCSRGNILVIFTPIRSHMVSFEELERYIEDKKEDVEGLDIFERSIEIESTKEFITSLYGPRRSGKTYLFYLLLKKLVKTEALYLNFDDIQLRNWTSEDIMESVTLFHEISGREPDMIMLDEIQNIEGWEMAVKTLYEKKRYKILITGSSSKLLSKEISTSLRGRSIGYPMLPLSFKEYLGFKGKNVTFPKTTRTIADMRSSLDEYLSEGSFPGLIFNKGFREKFYNDYIDLVVYRDLIERYGISNLELLNFIIRSVISSFSKEFSVNKNYNQWRSMRYEASKKTFYQYFSYLEDAMFTFTLNKYSRSLRTSELSTPKVYLADTGLASHVGGYQKGRAMENCVFLELLRRKWNGSGIDLYFWRDRSSEVDFIVCNRDEPSVLIQVAEILTEDNYRREIGALINAGKILKCDNLKLITWSGEEDVNENVEVIPLWKWLLADRPLK